MVILLIEKVIDNKMFPKSTAGLYISDSYQRNFISHRHRIFYGLEWKSQIFHSPLFLTFKHFINIKYRQYYAVCIRLCC